VSSSSGEADDSPVEVYLDTLVASMTLRHPRALRHLLAETEAHLWDAVQQGLADGMTQHGAEEAAVSRFGSVELLAADEQRRTRPSWISLVRQVMSTGVLLGAVGAIAVGMSGLVAGAFWAIGGQSAVVAVAPGQRLSSADCARWLAADPTARSCRGAALSDWAWETVAYRVALGVLGCLALGLYLALRRRTAPMGGWYGLPQPVASTIAVTLFAAAAAWTIGMGIDTLAVDSGRGNGQWFSAAIVCLCAAGWFGWRLAGDLRSHRFDHAPPCQSGD
jgi:hypothetical protein